MAQMGGRQGHRKSVHEMLMALRENKYFSSHRVQNCCDVATVKRSAGKKRKGETRMIDWRQFKTKSEAIKYLMETIEGCKTAKEAERYIRANVKREPYYQGKIIKYINSIPSAFAWKEAAGAYSRKGIPDVSAVINGRYYGFEVKRPLIGVLKKMQEQTIKKIRAAGGKAYVVTYTDEVEEILKKEGEI